MESVPGAVATESVRTPLACRARNDQCQRQHARGVRTTLLFGHEPFYAKLPVGIIKDAMPAKTKATRDYHPAKHTRATSQAKTTRRRIEIPKKVEGVELKISGREVRLTNLNKLFWPDLKITKRDLIQYYADVSPLLLPPKDRAMVMTLSNSAAENSFHETRAVPATAMDRVVFNSSWLEM